MKLATNERSDKMFPADIKTLSPEDSLPLPGGYIHVLNHFKNQTLKRLFGNLQQMNEVKGVSVDIKTLSPGICLPLPRGYIHV